MSELVNTFAEVAIECGLQGGDESELSYMKAKADLLAHIRSLETFHRQVTKAAGDLTGLSDGHAFEIHWCLGEDGEPEPGTAFITAGMIRRAAAGKEVRHG